MSNKKNYNQEDVMALLEGQMINFPYDEVYKKIFFKECSLAGLSFHLEKGDEL